MPRNVHSIIDDLQSGLNELRMHIENLGLIFRGETTSPDGRKTPSRRNRVHRARRRVTGSTPVKKARKKTAMSPALRKQRQLQGRYMALVRRLPKQKQAQVKKVRQKKGYEAALRMMG